MIHSIQIEHKDVTSKVLELNMNGFTVIHSKIKENNMIDLIYRNKQNIDFTYSYPIEKNSQLIPKKRIHYIFTKKWRKLS